MNTNWLKYLGYMHLTFFPLYVYADRYGMNDPTDEKSQSMPVILYLYIFAGIWAFTAKDGPLKEFGNQNPTLSIALFVIVIPITLAFIFI